MSNINIYGTLVRPVETDKIVRGIQVEGGYFVCQATPTAGSWQKGQLCYVTGTEANPVDKFYQYNGSTWVVKEFGSANNATQSAPGLMSAADKQKLDGIETGAKKNVQADWNATSGDTAILNKPTFGELAFKNIISANELASGINTTLSRAEDAYTHSTSAHAPIDAEKNVQSDWEETDQNSDAFIKNKPSIPKNIDDLTNNVGFTKVEGSTTNGNIKINGTETTVYTHPANHSVSMITGLAKVATSGSYNDLSDKPSIPTPPSPANGTLTIQKNGTAVATFSANQADNITANIAVPTKTSELTNDKGFITGYTEEDPTVPAWAKEPNKPSYNLGEISDDTNYVRMTATERAKLSGIAEGAEVNVQADWKATSGDAAILNKPNALPNPYALIINDTTSYTGESEVKMTTPNQTICTNEGSFDSNVAVKFVNGDNTTVVGNSTENTIKINVDLASLPTAAVEIITWYAGETVTKGV